MTTTELDEIDFCELFHPEAELDAETSQDPELPDPADPIDTKIVCPFTVIVDNQEQAPYHFLNVDPFSVVPLITDRHLKTGD